VQAKLLIQLNATLNAASQGKGNSGGGKGNTTATTTNTANASGKGNTSTMASVPALRAGYPMYDGFDDSSTFMSREIVLAFAEHYPEPGESTLHSRPAPTTTTTSTHHLLPCLRSLVLVHRVQLLGSGRRHGPWPALVAVVGQLLAPPALRVAGQARGEDR